MRLYSTKGFRIRTNVCATQDGQRDLLALGDDMILRVCYDEDALNFKTTELTRNQVRGE